MKAEKGTVPASGKPLQQPSNEETAVMIKPGNDTSYLENGLDTEQLTYQFCEWLGLELSTT